MMNEEVNNIYLSQLDEIFPSKTIFSDCALMQTQYIDIIVENGKNKCFTLNHVDITKLT